MVIKSQIIDRVRVQPHAARGVAEAAAGTHALTLTLTLTLGSMATVCVGVAVDLALCGRHWQRDWFEYPAEPAVGRAAASTHMYPQCFVLIASASTIHTFKQTKAQISRKVKHGDGRLGWLEQVWQVGLRVEVADVAAAVVVVVVVVVVSLRRRRCQHVVPERLLESSAIGAGSAIGAAPGRVDRCRKHSQRLGRASQRCAPPPARCHA